MALPTLATTDDVLAQVPDLNVTDTSTPISTTTVADWLSRVTAEITSRLRGVGVHLDSITLDEAATGWLKEIAVRGTAARLLRARRLYEHSEDVRRQFYGDIARIERDPSTLGVKASSEGPFARKRRADEANTRTRVTMDRYTDRGELW